MLTWNKSSVLKVQKVLNNDYGDILISTIKLTDTFIKNVNAGNDIRQEYLNAVQTILHIPEQLIYFIRTLSKLKIMISFKEVPEFRSLVAFYESLVRQARCL